MNAETAASSDTREPSEWGPRGTVGVSFAAALAFADVRLSIGASEILHGVSFSVAPGEIVCLLGESGSGKSTILRAATGVLPIQGGVIRINDEIVSAPGRTVAPERRGIGLMFQDFALFPHLTVLENAAFGLRKLGRAEAMRQARHALSRVGLARRADDYPSQLSGGQQQRLALARAVAPRPGILALDEPFSGLDMRLRQTVREQTIGVLRETRATSVIVTHDPEEAMLLGDRIALLRAGRVVQIASADEIYHNPVDLEAARFMSSLGEVPGVVADGVADTPLGKVPAPGRPQGARVVVGIRPVGSVSLSLSAPGTVGRIVARRAALGVDNLEIQVAGVDQLLHLRRQSDPSMEPGRDVWLTLDPNQILVFDAP